MKKLFKIFIIISVLMSLVSCDALLCEMGSSTACVRYNKEVWTQ